MYRRQQISFKNFVRVLIVSQKCYCQFLPSSTTRIIRNKNAEDDHNLKPIKTDENETDSGKKQCTNNLKEFRVNEVNIQMISRNIYEQLFKTSNRKLDPEVVKSCQDHLIRHGIDYKKAEYMPDVHMTIPELKGKDIVEHFYNIGEEQSAPYRNLLEQLAGSALPTPPKVWSQAAGWTRYCGATPPQPVAYPADDALVFDVEVLMSAGKRPTLACAVSTDAWYGWVSQPVANRSPHEHHETTNYEDLIPLESDGVSPIDEERPRLVVGHNVCYDRAKVKEQYLLTSSALRFWDTMSMHTCVSGVTSYQRAMLKSKEKDGSGNDGDWMDISSLNSLSEVHKLYCGASIDKQTRDVFVEGTMSDVLDNFQEVMRYCASDVQATCRVLRELWPLFQERFPHPITLAGMLELGSSYLPVNSNWLQYIDSAETVFEDLKLETRQLLSLKADEACRLMINEQYKTDLWMWDQDWSTQRLKLKRAKVRKTRKKDEESQEKHVVQAVATEKTKECRVPENGFEILNEEFIEHQSKKFKNNETNDSEIEVLSKKFEYLFELGSLLPARRPYLPGYPAWYRKLCTKPGKDPDWAPGANNITTSMQITPKLLRLSWEGYPLHHLASEKWGFLVPCSHRRPVTYEPEDEPQLPLKELLMKCPVVGSPGLRDGSDDAMEKISKKVEDDMGRRSYYARKKLDDLAAQHNYNGLGVWSGLQLQGCCHFFRLPHKDGPKHKVGNPLAKDFLEMFSQNVLSAQGDAAERVVNFGRMMSYWRNNRERISGQQVVWLPPERLPPGLRQETRRYGAILPQVVVAGTLTRRASEPTWMTASNARADRVGSELRAMVHAPPGYRLLGADVDSQELWIASLLGDSTSGLAGGTAFGWSVLAGNKQNDTDLHSLVAGAAGISRDHAKVINYARIYGAGQNFAERLLKQFNPTMTNSEAKTKAHKMFTTTKGRRVYRLQKKYMEGFMDEDLEGQSVEMTSYQAQRLARLSGKRVEEMFERPQWVGGTESEMFNKLEEIADQEEPETAFLSAKLSRAVAATAGRWDGTKHNWAVQSAAADFLHLMLACMRWRVTPRSRFCLSFHDEVRYLVPEEHKYEAARALQLTNLLTRAFCSQRAGLPDLPLSVSFFTSVEVDSVLRKECAADCVTPSNPHGLRRGYGVPAGESLTVADALHKRDITLDAL